WRSRRGVASGMSSWAHRIARRWDDVGAGRPIVRRYRRRRRPCSAGIGGSLADAIGDEIMATCMLQAFALVLGERRLGRRRRLRPASAGVREVVAARDLRGVEARTARGEMRDSVLAPDDVLAKLIVVLFVVVVLASKEQRDPQRDE